MRSLSSSLVIVSFGLAACSAPATVATISPTPNPTPSAPAAAAPSTRIPATTMSEAPKNWQLLDQGTDHVPGISAERAMNERWQAARTPKQTVLVAIIDNGIDTTPRRPQGEPLDEPEGRAPTGGTSSAGATERTSLFDTFEVTREYARCHGKAAASGAPPITDAARCTEIDAAFNKQRSSIQRTADNYRQVNDLFKQIVPVLARAASVPTDSLTPERVRAVNSSNPQLARAHYVSRVPARRARRRR